MNIKKYILSNINVLNFMLLAVSFILYFTLAYPISHTDIKVNIPKVDIETVTEIAKIVPENIPTSQDYIVVAEKNLFHPERRLPSEAKEGQIAGRPEIIFYGSIITEETKIALVEDKKNPYTTPGRVERLQSLKEGAVIGGYTLKEVNPETIVLVRGDDEMIINLRDQKDRKPEARTASPEMPAGRLPNQPPIMRPPGAAGVRQPSIIHPQGLLGAEQPPSY